LEKYAKFWILKILKKKALIHKFNCTPPPKKKSNKKRKKKRKKGGKRKKEKRGKKISFYRPTTWHTFTKRK